MSQKTIQDWLGVIVCIEIIEFFYTSLEFGLNLIHPKIPVHHLLHPIIELYHYPQWLSGWLTEQQCEQSFFESSIVVCTVRKIWFLVPRCTRLEIIIITVNHYCDVIMGVMASQITSRTIVYQTIYSMSDQRKHQSSASLAIVRRIHRWTVNSPDKRPVRRKMFPFDDVIMGWNVYTATGAETSAKLLKK